MERMSAEDIPISDLLWLVIKALITEFPFPPINMWGWKQAAASKIQDIRMVHCTVYCTNVPVFSVH